MVKFAKYPFVKLEILQETNPPSRRQEKLFDVFSLSGNFLSTGV